MHTRICLALASSLAISLASCAQFTTSTAERAGLKAAADAADDAYLACLSEQAGRYLGTSDDAQAIVTVALKGCTGAREAAGRAQSALQSTNYILAESEVETALKSLDAAGAAAITGQVLNSRSAPPAVAPATAGPALASGGAAAGSDGYLRCMREQGWRWATVQEPATVIADAAHGRCAAQLAGIDGREQVESDGRAIVVGIVLDRKAQPPATAP